MLVRLHHTALSTPDLDRLVAFYRDHFGFALAFEFAWDEAHLAFEVKDIDGEVARLGAAAVPLLSPPVPQANVEVCYGRDPDGNLFGLIEWFGHDVEAAGAR
jgi:catechol 2,3-dioxygenase-like lactoylglutathione lyase family enzyme